MLIEPRPSLQRPNFSTFDVPAATVVPVITMALVALMASIELPLQPFCRIPQARGIENVGLPNPTTQDGCYRSVGLSLKQPGKELW